MKAEKTESLDEIFADFAAMEGDRRAGVSTERKPITIWLSTEEKAVYDRIQESSGRKFSKKLKQLVKTAIAIADKRAS